MRTTTLFIVLLLSMSGLASAQDDWTAYVNKDIGRMREIATRAQIKVD